MPHAMRNVVSRVMVDLSGSEVFGNAISMPGNGNITPRI
jgi:hypothetical protein